MTEPAIDAGLLPHEYETVVAPCLQVAAELAAARNDPTLFNDLASMLTLRALIRGVSECYLDDISALAQHSESIVFERAPTAACAMVLEEFDVPSKQIPAMLAALAHAEEFLQRESVLASYQGIVEQAYLDLKNNRFDRGMNALTTAGSLMVAAIDEWEAKRSG